jgi:hypothetical protein
MTSHAIALCAEFHHPASLSKRGFLESWSHAPPEPLPDFPKCGLIEHEEMLEISTMTFFLCLAGLAILICGLSRLSRYCWSSRV